MRQAGRYLPEYLALRKQAGSFLDLCYTPEFAVEVTLQPIDRFGFDGAILFSDILVIPDALGQDVSFKEGIGPVLAAINDESDIANLSLDGVLSHLSPVYEAVGMIQDRLPDEVALIGFAGAPWTVACYMIEGGTTRDFHRVKRMMFETPACFARLIDLLVEATITHLVAQSAAGAEALQIFESHAGVMPADQFQTWVVEPIRRIIRGVREMAPEIPIIGFPRGAGPLTPSFVEATGVHAVSLDTAVSLIWADETLPKGIPVQGNLDPVLLMIGGAPMYAAVDRILAETGDRPLIFNLGHGVDKTTNSKNVADLVSYLRNVPS